MVKVHAHYFGWVEKIRILEKSVVKHCNTLLELTHNYILYVYTISHGKSRSQHKAVDMLVINWLYANVHISKVTYLIHYGETILTFVISEYQENKPVNHISQIPACQWLRISTVYKISKYYMYNFWGINLCGFCDQLVVCEFSSLACIK